VGAAAVAIENLYICGAVISMKDKLIMEVAVTIDLNEIMHLEGTAGKVTMIPFGGTVKGEIFNGVVLPGGVDTQVTDLNGVNHMCARYMLKGTDIAGSECRIYVENNGCQRSVPETPFRTIPVFYTDSVALAPYLHRAKFRGEGRASPEGVVISFFEVDAE